MTVMDTGMAREVRQGRNGDGNYGRGCRRKQGRAAGDGVKKGSVGRICVGVLGGERGETVPIRFGTYNICNGRNRGLESVLRGVSQASMDLDIFQETKVTDGIYTRGSATVGIAPLQRTHQADTVSECHCSTGRRRISWWRPSSNLDPTSSASRWRQGSGGGTS